MTAVVIRGDAAHLPLPDASVDLIVTSPPYWSLRSYTDGGEHYDGQIGDEPTPQLYVDALLDCTREWVRVLKPAGSMFVVLGDKYSERAGPAWRGSNDGYTGRSDRHPRTNSTAVAPRKSLLGLPWRYALACIDELGLTLRQDVIGDAYVWSKPNGMPESVKDRCRRSHEYVFHLTASDRYYSATDEIRDPHVRDWSPRSNGGRGGWDRGDHLNAGMQHAGAHPLGALPGSVWTIATQPLTLPDWLGVDHRAAFPLELPRRIIRGWSPAGICTACGEGRRPVTRIDHEHGWIRRTDGQRGTGRNPGENVGQVVTNRQIATITGYACACTPRTSYRGKRGDWREGRHVMPEVLADDWHSPGASVPRRSGGFGTKVPLSEGEWEYHLDDWIPPPVTPAVVLDPFGGTGTTALVADVLGRTGITIDRSADYCRAATWRTRDPGQRAQAMQVPKPPPVPDGQGELDLFGEAAS